MLALTPADVVLPEEQGLCPHTGYAELILGAKKGTKVKRPQVVVIRGRDDPGLTQMLRIAKLTTPNGCRLVPYSIETYRAWLKRVQEYLKLELGVGPHSPRAGFASEGRARGIPFADLQEQCSTERCAGISSALHWNDAICWSS